MKLNTRTLGHGLVKFIEKFYVLVPKKKHKPKAITMYDSVTVPDIPLGAAAVAGYVDGLYKTYPTLLTHFPHAKHLSIAVSAATDADCLDVEKGDASIPQAPAWVKKQHARGLKRPVVYTSVSQAQALVDALEKGGVPRTAYRLWTAHYTSKPHWCSVVCSPGFKGTADATQYKSTTSPNLDTSLVRPGFFS